MQQPDFYWSKHKDAELTAMWLEGRSVDEIKAFIGCYRRNVARRARRLGLPPREPTTTSPPVWSEGRAERLRALWGIGLSAPKIAAELAVSRNAVVGKAARLGIRHTDSTTAAQILPNIADRIAALQLDRLRDDTRLKLTVPAREGQSAFREAVLTNGKFTCCVTGCSVPQVLQAAHIVPYSMLACHETENGLVLRSDIHVLFDAGLLTIGAKEFDVVIADDLLSTEYARFHGRSTALPFLKIVPSTSNLRWHHDNVFRPNRTETVTRIAA